MSTPDHEARAALMRAADAGDTVMGALVSHLGAVQALQAVRERAAPPGFALAEELAGRFQSWHARLAACDPAADLEAGERAGARLVIPGDAEWPTQLDALGSGRPLGLWLHGTADLRFSCLRSVAVVGARAATSYGVHVAAQFGIGLSEAGWTVVSGGAFGVDGAAHRGALAAGGPTVVVLACGVDYCYPAEHRSLFAGARDRGVLVSECPPGVRPTRSRFLIRNRVIAALSRGTLVVEAALRSGALNTAGHALTLDRHLGAVPGPITSALSDGCHRLLRERKAVCVTTPEEMIELVGVMGDDLAPALRAPALPRDSLPEQTKRVLDAVPARISAGPATIAVTAGVDLNTALSALGSLAATGYIERTAGGWRARRPVSPIYPKAEPALPRSTPAPAADDLAVVPNPPREASSASNSGVPEELPEVVPSMPDPCGVPTEPAGSEPSSRSAAAGAPAPSAPTEGPSFHGPGSPVSTGKSAAGTSVHAKESLVQGSATPVSSAEPGTGASARAGECPVRASASPVSSAEPGTGASARAEECLVHASATPVSSGAFPAGASSSAHMGRAPSRASALPVGSAEFGAGASVRVGECPVQAPASPDWAGQPSAGGCASSVGLGAAVGGASESSDWVGGLLDRGSRSESSVCPEEIAGAVPETLACPSALAGPSASSEECADPGGLIPRPRPARE
ncbi:DNA-processing protein DprA [Nonomuraea sp. NPDC050478]|uniref:DNA-processing protein DprA n=1 Tax=Nonomuraea sp. NPDC050478 TaxID=3364365 RepID=UPI0037A7D3CB